LLTVNSPIIISIKRNITRIKFQSALGHVILTR